MSNNKKKIQKKNITNVKTRQITETKATCKACGNVWHYGKSDSLEQVGNASSNCGKSMMCCTCSPLALLIPDKKITDLNKCPKCRSRAVEKEKVTHDV
jgi:DNA-directed RNA polymerase subunit RPC12/RpoP